MSHIRSLDLARGFTVLMMVPVHTVLLYSDPVIYHTLLIKMLAFVAEGPGAQLFMMLMGIYTGLSKTRTTKKVLLKSLLLLMAGYGLNMVKFVIPYRLGLLPEHLLLDLQITKDSNAWIQLIAIGDIFHFAALALPITYALSRSKHWYAAALTVLIIFGAQYLWDIRGNNPVNDYLLKLIGGQPPQVFFPLFPWLVYPLIGMMMGKWWMKTEEKYFQKLGITGAVILLIYYSVRLFISPKDTINFYRTQWPETLQHIAIVFCTLFSWDWLSKNIPQNRIFRFLQYSGRHITKLYIIQWIVIMWCLPFPGYQQLQWCSSMAWIIFTTTATYAIAYIIIAHQEFATVTNK
jgi:uncharacterized membrane protein